MLPSTPVPLFRELVSNYLDIGENLNVPDDFLQSKIQSCMWRRHLIKLRITRITDCLQYMLKEEGVQSLWRNSFINVSKLGPSAPSTALFHTLILLDHTLEPNNQQDQFCFTNATCALLLQCLSRNKTRTQSATPPAYFGTTSGDVIIDVVLPVETMRPMPMMSWRKPE